LTLLACATCSVSGHDLLTGVLDGLWPTLQIGTFIRDELSTLPHYMAFTHGVLDLRSTVYFIALSACFLFLNHAILERHKQ